MTLLSPVEDFKTRTLAAIEGKLARLCYIAELRDFRTGQYRHWGMERSHGQAAAEEALQAAHCEVFIEVLRTPIGVLAGELRHDSARGIEVDRLKALKSMMYPRGIPKGSERHFSSVLLALHGLASARGYSNRRAAWPRPRPVR